MARAMWSGSISFGLVNVPVKVFSAVRDHAVHFHQVDKSSGSRIRYEKVAEKTGKKVEAKDLELGYELDKAKLVVVDPDEIASLRPRTTRTIDIADFVDLAEIDPAYYNRTYWLAPDGQVAERAYRLLVAAMEERAKVGIGMVVMRNRQYLAAIRPREHALALSTMRFADEVLDRSSVDGIPSASSKPAANELRLATQIIDSMASAWKPQQYRDTYTNQVRDLIKRHEEGRDIVVDEEPPTGAALEDLTAALQASLEAARKGSGKGSTSSRSANGRSTGDRSTNGGRTTGGRSTGGASTGGRTARKGAAGARRSA